MLVFVFRFLTDNCTEQPWGRTQELAASLFSTKILLIFIKAQKAVQRMKLAHKIKSHSGTYFISVIVCYCPGV